MLMKAWKDPVWSKIIATAILLLLGSVGTYVLGVWPSIIKFSADMYDFLNSTQSVKNWLIGIALIPWFLIIYIIFLLILEAFKNNKADLDWRSYTTDYFFGLNWKWSYRGENINDLFSFCPECQYQIFANSVGGYDMARCYQYVCDDCGYCAQDSDVEPEMLKHRVKLKIQKNLRTEEWKNKVIG